MQFRVMQPIRVNGTLLKAGDLFDFTPEDAVPLLESGAISEVHQPFKAGRVSINLVNDEGQIPHGKH